MRREFERVTCPGCGRHVSAYVPKGGDGTDVKIVAHNWGAAKAGPCPASGKLLREYVDARERAERKGRRKT